MTRKHFKVIAEVIRDRHIDFKNDDHYRAFIATLGVRLKAINSKFDAGKFVDTIFAKQSPVEQKELI